MANMSDIPKDEQWLIEFDETECFDDPGQKLAEAYDIICGLRSKLKAANDRAEELDAELGAAIIKIAKLSQEIEEETDLRIKAEAKVAELVEAIEALLEDDCYQHCGGKICPELHQNCYQHCGGANCPELHQKLCTALARAKEAKP